MHVIVPRRMWHDGALYASGWSFAGAMGMQRAGQVVRVPAGAFR